MRIRNGDTVLVIGGKEKGRPVGSTDSCPKKIG